MIVKRKRKETSRSVCPRKKVLQQVHQRRNSGTLFENFSRNTFLLWFACVLFAFRAGFELGPPYIQELSSTRTRVVFISILLHLTHFIYYLTIYIMSVVGIDFGNSKCVISVAKNRVIDVLQNEQGRRNTESFVAFSGNERICGDNALSQMSSNFKNTVKYMKRLLGCKADHPDVKTEQTYAPYYEYGADADNNLTFSLNYSGEKQQFRSEQLAACLLQKLRLTTEKATGSKVSDCVISCPAYWTDSTRRALMDAARLGGLNPLRIINDTTAVAINYGILRPLPTDQSIKVMFLDIGDCSTTASVMSLIDGRLKVLSHASDEHIGGRNFELLLVNYLVEQVRTRYNMDPTTNKKATFKLFKEAGRMKKVLSANQQCPWTIEYLMNDTDVTGMIERSEFEKMVADAGLLQRISAVLTRSLEMANTKTEELSSVEVVGGCHRIPCVKTILSNELKTELSHTCDADESVSRGCAFMCAMLSPSFRVRPFDVQDVTPYAVHLSWGPVGGPDDDGTTLFAAGSAIPSTKMVTYRDRTEPFQLTATYAEPEKLPVGSNTHIARFVVTDVPSKPADAGDDWKAPIIKVKLRLDLHGLMSIGSASYTKETITFEQVPVKESTPEAEMTDAAKPADAAAAADAPAADAPAADATADAPTAGAETGDKPVDAAPMETEEAATGDAAMEAEPEAKAAPKMETKEVRKKTKIPLNVSAHYLSGMSQAEFNAAFEKEAAMYAQDRAIIECAERRNELEAYILNMRSRVQSGDLREFVEAKVADKFVADLTEMEDWLYEDGYDAQKSEYVKRLNGLRVVGGPAEQRKWELEHRDAAISGLKSAVMKNTVLAQSPDEKYAHISDEDKQSVLNRCNDEDKWIATTLSQLDHLPKHEDSKVTCSQINTKASELEKFCAAIMNKPKPKPKEEPKPEPVPEAGDAAAAAAAGGDATMETEPASGGAADEDAGDEIPAPETMDES
jgi:heat shock 70kDa protein 4